MLSNKIWRRLVVGYERILDAKMIAQAYRVSGREVGVSIRYHLLFLSNPLVEPDNNLCGRKTRVLKGKINQAIPLRNFEHLVYFCECLSVPNHWATDDKNNLYQSTKDIFKKPKPTILKPEN